MMTIPAITGAFSAALVPIIAGSRDRRYVLSLLTIFLICSSVICALSTSFLILLIGHALLGVSLGGVLALSLGGDLLYLPLDFMQLQYQFLQV
ncbi:hypothetical protein WKH74_14750 [Acinetobacter baumannii]